MPTQNILTSVIGSLVLASSAQLFAEGTAMPLPLPAPVKQEAAVPAEGTEANGVPLPEPEKPESKYLVTDGTTISAKEKGISLTPPAGWEYSLSFPNATMILQAPVVPDAKYRRTIQVTAFADPFYFSETEMGNFEKKLIKAFSQGDASISNYRVRNHQPVELSNGMKAELYYTEFSVDGGDLMQMHVLVSSSTHHFVVTYTDLASYFDAETAPEPHLNEAWEIMNTVVIDAPAVSPVVPAIKFVVAAIVIVAFAGVFFFINNRRKAKQYDDIASGTGSEMTNPPMTLSSQVSLAPQTLRSMHEAKLDKDTPVTGAEELDFKDVKKVS